MTTRSRGSAKFTFGPRSAIGKFWTVDHSQSGPGEGWKCFKLGPAAKAIDVATPVLPQVLGSALAARRRSERIKEFIILIGAPGEIRTPDP
jgi:hypothetical protein